MDTIGTVLYFSHGGGPLPLLGDPTHEAMIAFLKKLSSQLARPEAILVISAHWEEREATLTAAPNPPLFYDYYGFPEESYNITYPAPGNPTLVKRIVDLLKERNMPVNIDNKRGFDHGVFIPMKIMYPEADIPIVQLSLIKGLDPKTHIQLGKALQPLLSENILIVGSGFSFHNMRAFMNQTDGNADVPNDEFQDWLIETCVGAMEQTERERKLTEWEDAPNARYCHPREEHLLPLHVCAGMASEAGKIVFDDQIFEKRCIGVLWTQ
jgi:4,5-DOPA dioxygenase extradiol